MPTLGHRRHRHVISSSTAALALLLTVPLPVAFTPVAARPGIALAAASASISSSSSSMSLSASLYTSSSVISATTSTAVTPASVTGATPTADTTPSAATSIASTTSRPGLMSNLGLSGLLNLRDEQSDSNPASSASVTKRRSSATSSLSASNVQTTSSYPNNIYFNWEGYVTTTSTMNTEVASAAATSTSATAAETKASHIEAYDNDDPPLLQSTMSLTTSSASVSDALPTSLPVSKIPQTQNRVVSNLSSHRNQLAIDDDIDDSDNDDSDGDDDNDEDDNDGSCSDEDESESESDNNDEEELALSSSDVHDGQHREVASDPESSSSGQFPVLSHTANNDESSAVEAAMQAIHSSLSLMQGGQSTAAQSVRRAVLDVFDAAAFIVRQRNGGVDGGDNTVSDGAPQRRGKFPDIGKHRNETRKHSHDHDQAPRSRSLPVVARHAPDTRFDQTNGASDVAPQALDWQHDHEQQEIALIAALDDWALISAWFKEHLPADLHAKVHQALRRPAP